VRGDSNTEQARAAGVVAPHPGHTCLRLVVYMTRNSQEERQRKREASEWLAGLVEIVAGNGTRRALTGDEAAEAVLRQWKADEAG